MSVILQEIIDQFWITAEDAPWTPKTDAVPLNQIRTWMKSGDIEILGYAYSMLDDARFRITPALSLDEYIEFLEHYYGRCFRENPQGEWADSSYSAGWDLVHVFVRLWDDEEVPRSVLAGLKEWLAAVYRDGDERLQTCIKHATLEHLFERTPIKKYFSSWKDDPVLTEAFREASLWRRKTPLSG